MDRCITNGKSLRFALYIAETGSSGDGVRSCYLTFPVPAELSCSLWSNADKSGRPFSDVKSHIANVQLRSLYPDQTLPGGHGTGSGGTSRVF